MSKTFDTKTEAQAAGCQTAKGDETEHVIHNLDGKIAQKNTYSKEDSFPPRG